VVTIVFYAQALLHASLAGAECERLVPAPRWWNCTLPLFHYHTLAVRPHPKSCTASRYCARACVVVCTPGL
jgi:hypothetical protein